MNHLLLVLAVLSLALLLWQWAEAVRFPWRRRGSGAGPAPGLTLLKPLKGCDSETETCLESWLSQVYRGPMQVLFLVGREDDPAVPVVQRLIRAHAGRDIELVVCPARLGPNSKVSKLAQGAVRAKHEVLVVSDADVEVPAGFLDEVVEPFQDGRVALVNPFYQLAHPVTLAMRWEALAVNADFWSGVLQARRLGGMRFALGAVMAVRRSALERIGGFGALVHHLADDYELGRRVTALSHELPLGEAGVFPPPAPGAPGPVRPKIALCGSVVACREGRRGWRSVWRHQLRWARTIRFCQPVPYAFSLLSQSTFWFLAWALVTRHPAAWVGLGVCLVCRLGMAAHCQWRLTRSWRHLPFLWLAPVKDLLQVVLWGMAFIGNTVEWRGERYRVRRGGRLKPLSGGSA